MNHIDFARWAQRQHDELGLAPTLEPGGDYQAAHHPLPRGMGDETIPLHRLDHVIHDIYQSEAVGNRHFYSADVRAALYETPSYWPLGWMDACDLYEKWASQPNPMSEATRQKLREAQTGKKHSEATKQKIGENWVGRRHTEASKKKISEAKKGTPSYWKGRKRSEESRKKMSEAALKREAKKRAEREAGRERGDA